MTRERVEETTRFDFVSFCRGGYTPYERYDFIRLNFAEKGCFIFQLPN